ncbi:hypothetical protein N7505_007310 [Penicillium chrysogenum]|uniref:Uncharacterized protein n=1 Tax=Penicillium chrysogenum TaxID=5076 RepID=A0ABQ8WD15_PENCH|nr:hypothetical protein N7505_007310 [Penicillium chrysogenum]
MTNLAWANHQDIEQGDTIPSGSGGSLEFRLSSDSTEISPGLYSAALLPPTALTELTESGDSTDSAKVDLGDVEIPCCETGELNVRVTYNQTIRSGLWVLSMNGLQYDINIQNPSRKMKRDLESRSNQNAITAYCGIGSEKSSVESASPGSTYFDRVFSNLFIFRANNTWQQRPLWLAKQPPKLVRSYLRAGIRIKLELSD